VRIPGQRLDPELFGNPAGGLRLRWLELEDAVRLYLLSRSRIRTRMP
jgi:hypothetical protein